MGAAPAFAEEEADTEPTRSEPTGNECFRGLPGYPVSGPAFTDSLGYTFGIGSQGNPFDFDLGYATLGSGARPDRRWRLQ